MEEDREGQSQPEQGLKPDEVNLLRETVCKVQHDPTLLHTPELVFFRDFLLSWGATIPKAAAEKPSQSQSCPQGEEKPKEEPKEKAKEPEEPEAAKEEGDGDGGDEDEELLEEPEEQPDQDEEDPERLLADQEPYPDRGPEGEMELTDEQMDAQCTAKQAAAEAAEDGDLAKALVKFTEAIKIGNATAMMYNKRAELLLKLKRPNACISDCTAALGINADSGKAYRIRGKAQRKLGNWEEAHKDLSLGQKLDYDDETAEVQKLVDEKWKKIAARQTQRRLREERIAQKKKEKELKKRKAAQTAARKAYEEQKRREAEEEDAQCGGFPGMAGIDAELLAALKNPKVAAALQDVLNNPANISKYQSDPEVMRVLSKLMAGKGGGKGKGGGMFGGMGGMFGGMGGMPFGGSCSGSSRTAASSGPTIEEVDD